jgi:hypothetical protein
MALGGVVDYRGLDRLSSAFQTANDLMLRNRQTENMVAQDQADKSTASQVLQDFQAQTGVNEQGVPRTPEETYRAAAEANAKLAVSGGRHSQAASSQVMQYLEAKMKMQPPKKQMPPMFKEVAPAGTVTPKIITKNGVQYEEQEYMEMTKGERIPNSTHFVPHNPPTSLFGGNANAPERNVGGLTEEDPQTGDLRIKRDPATGKPIRLTRKEVSSIQQQETDNVRQTQARLDWLESQMQGEQANLDYMQTQYNSDPSDELGTAIRTYGSALTTRSAEVERTRKMLKRSQSLLKELDVYDPDKAYPTGGEGSTGQATGYGSRKKSPTLVKK